MIRHKHSDSAEPRRTTSFGGSSVSHHKLHPLAQVESWLGSLKTGQARFTQTGYDGGVTTGTFYISRPGRLRFVYDNSKDFAVADGLLIHFYDSQQRQASSAPIGTTLADFLLRSSPRLDGDLSVTNIRSKNGILSMAVSQTGDPAAGQIVLNFTEEPFMLSSWTVHDAQGLTTEVALTDFRTGMPLPPSLFIFKDPSGRGHLNN